MRKRQLIKRAICDSRFWARTSDGRQRARRLAIGARQRVSGARQWLNVAESHSLGRNGTAGDAHGARKNIRRIQRVEAMRGAMEISVAQRAQQRDFVPMAYLPTCLSGNRYRIKVIILRKALAVVQLAGTVS